MKTVSATIFAVIFVFGVGLGYVLGTLDSPPQHPLLLVFKRTDQKFLQLPISKDDAGFFILPQGVGITNINLRGINEF